MRLSTRVDCDTDPFDDIADSGSQFFFAYIGIAAALVFANLGSAYGTAKAGVGIASLGVIDSSKVIKGLIPIIMAGILGIYGVIVAVILSGKIPKSMTKEEGGKTVPSMDARSGYQILAAGLCCGLSSLAAGLAIGVAGDASVRAYAQSDGIFVGMIILMIFSEAIGLYGFIIALII